MRQNMVGASCSLLSVKIQLLDFFMPFEMDYYSLNCGGINTTYALSLAQGPRLNALQLIFLFIREAANIGIQKTFRQKHFF